MVISESMPLLNPNLVSSAKEEIMIGLVPIIETCMSKDTTAESNVV